MRLLFLAVAFAAASAGAQHPSFSVKDIMSAPYATGLTVAPGGESFAWVENAEGVHNLWVAGLHEPAHKVTAYTEDDAQDISGLAWSADGREIAYALGAENGQGGRPANPAELQRNTAVTMWVANAVGNNATVRVAEGRNPLFLANGRLLFLRGGQIWVADVPKLGRRGVDDDKSAAEPPHGSQLVYDRGSAGGLTLSPDGKLLAYVSHRRGHSFIALYDFAARRLQFVSPSTGNDSAPVFSPDGTQLAWLREPWTGAPEFAGERVSKYPWSVQVASLTDLKARTLYQPEAGQRGSVIPRFATGNPRVWWAAGNRVLFCSEADGWVHLYSVDAAATGVQPTLLTPGPGEVEDVSVSRDGKTVYWASNQRRFSVTAWSKLDVDRRHLWWTDVSQQSLAVFPLTTGDGIETRPTELADRSLVAMASSAKVPMHPVRVDPLGVIKDVRDGWLPAAYPLTKIIVPQQMIFPSQVDASSPSPSLGIHAQLFLPAGVERRPDRNGEQKSTGNDRKQALRLHPTEQRALAGDPASAQDDNAGGTGAPRIHPAIVFFHGGPKRQMLLGYPAMDYYSNAYAMNQYLAAQGFIVLSVNYRCGIGYGLEFRQCQNAGGAGASEYNDALAAVAYLRSRGDVDMKRVGIWGGSYGGYFTALGLARNSDLFAAGVDYHGVHDWTIEDNARADWLRGTNAEVDAIAAKAVASSPIADVSKWRSPVLLIHGDDDPEVTYNQTPMLADALRSQGVHVEELIFPDEVHGFLLHRDWVKAYESEAEFFARQLQTR